MSTVLKCRNETHEVIKYLEYCVHKLHNEDPGVHNLLLSLYAKQVEWFALQIYAPMPLYCSVMHKICIFLSSLYIKTSLTNSYHFVVKYRTLLEIYMSLFKSFNFQLH